MYVPVLQHFFSTHTNSDLISQLSAQTLPDVPCQARGYLCGYSYLSWHHFRPTGQLQPSTQHVLYEPHLQYQHLCWTVGSSIHTRHHSRRNSYHCQLRHCNHPSTRSCPLPNHRKLRKVLPTQPWRQLSADRLNNTITVQEINPSTNANCTNLTPGLYYCVWPTAPWNATGPNLDSTIASPPAPTPSGSTSNSYEW